MRARIRLAQMLDAIIKQHLSWGGFTLESTCCDSSSDAQVFAEPIDLGLRSSQVLLQKCRKGFLRTTSGEAWPSCIRSWRLRLGVQGSPPRKRLAHQIQQRPSHRGDRGQSQRVQKAHQGYLLPKGAAKELYFPRRHHAAKAQHGATCELQKRLSRRTLALARDLCCRTRALAREPGSGRGSPTGGAPGRSEADPHSPSRRVLQTGSIQELPARCASVRRSQTPSRRLQQKGRGTAGRGGKAGAREADQPVATEEGAAQGARKRRRRGRGGGDRHRDRRATPELRSEAATAREVRVFVDRGRASRKPLILAPANQVYLCGWRARQ